MIELETAISREPAAPVSERPVLVIAPVDPGKRSGYRALKRTLDIIFSVLFGILLIVPMLIIAAWVWLDSKGPALFKQERVGKNGKTFVMLKFRSMVFDAEKDGPQWAQKEDDRCTRAGRILRATRLDELPQLWNILKGDMSFVGPRPERQCFYEEFEEYIHGFSNRLAVRPGLTGWAQVNGGYDLAPEEKIIYDMEYIKTRSIGMDLRCIFRTIRLVFTHEGAR